LILSFNKCKVYFTYIQVWYT